MQRFFSLLRRDLMLVVAFVTLASFTVVAEVLTPTEAIADDLAIPLSSMTQPVTKALRRQRGRPAKFDVPSRAVTLTLPETVIEKLGTIHPDISRAVVQVVDRSNGKKRRPPADLVVFNRRAVITVQPTASLTRRTGVELVPLPDGRALLAFDHGTSIADVELMVYDAIADPNLPDEDRQVFKAIGRILTDARRSELVRLNTRSIILVESPRRARAEPAKRPRRKTA